MKSKLNVNLHNRFDIEVRDAKDMSLKQSGQAENIVLNQMYSRLCTFSGYFHSIHFGRGTGTPTPERDTLFSRIGSKSATNEEVVRELPTSKWTRKITLMPEEFVGESITEVGIGSGSAANSMVTHAMIKDSEGQPLTIEKTDIDVVIIYATVFISFAESEDVKLYTDHTRNVFISYMLGQGYSDPLLELGGLSCAAPVEAMRFGLGTFTLTRTADVENKKAIFTTRLGISNANYDIYEMSLRNAYRTDLVASGIWNGHSIVDEIIAEGDGINTQFDIGRHDISNLVVKVDGEINNDYTLKRNSRLEYAYEKPFYEVVDKTEDVLDNRIYAAPYNSATVNWPIPTVATKVDSDELFGKEIVASIRGGHSVATGNRTVRLYIDTSNDEVTWTQRVELSATGGTAAIRTHTINYTDYSYLRCRWTGTELASCNYIRIRDPEDTRAAVIEFNTPPPLDSDISVSYTVPYVPKTSDYVLDVVFEVQFGEG